MYKGDVNPQEAFEQLSSNNNAVMIDVRTRAEWAFVGVPAVERMATISWQQFPSMQVNEEFVATVKEAGIGKDADIYLICRSGSRSAAAASLLTEAGFATCYNVAEGFEGDLDESRHRGKTNGWKARGLPWIQQ
ncbi:rhodanese-like domain-containing protein [Anderseniella sp. Alg231-50]|uniref:rhodanese-like domain-containing protein n=1 Tax=Anderseniella sp. Alg231-50 TaxID=1922226 RepID=UPI000D55E634